MSEATIRLRYALNIYPFLFLTLTLYTSLLAAPLPANAMTLVGKVVSVSAGDTVTLMDINERRYKIRLYGIACPKKDQPFAREAGRHTAKMVSRKKIKVRVYGKDKYGSKTGLVFADGVLVNESLIKKGLAWQYRNYCKESFCKAWLSFEEKAKKSKIGLWKHTNPIPPWE